MELRGFDYHTGRAAPQCDARTRLHESWKGDRRWQQDSSDGEWNKYRIECKGSSVKTWVNGVPCADLLDSLDARGIIGLQVHGIGNKEFKPYQVRWRNLRIREL